MRPTASWFPARRRASVAAVAGGVLLAGSLASAPAAWAQQPGGTPTPPSGNSPAATAPASGARGSDTTGSVARPPIDQRPSPSEASERGQQNRTIMRPEEGSASGGMRDAPTQR